MLTKRTIRKILGIVFVSILLLSLFHLISLISIFGLTNEVDQTSVSDDTKIPLKLVSDSQEINGYNSKAFPGLFFVLKRKLNDFSNPDDSKLGENVSKKQSLLYYITREPGITFRELHRISGFAMGVTQYHLNQLVNNEIESFRFGRCKHFFLKRDHFSDQEKILFALLRNTKIVTYLSSLVENGNTGYRQIDLVKLTGYNKYTISYFTKQLLLHGIITRTHNRLYLHETYSLLFTS